MGTRFGRIMAQYPAPPQAKRKREHAKMFIRDAWYVAAWADEIADKPLARRICNEPVVLFRDAEGHAAALLDMCCHRGHHCIWVR
jgi:phenylpropionate dioxygenase-like ring-hydroxylating dioxygenase large terminal subunit